MGVASRARRRGYHITGTNYDNSKFRFQRLIILGAPRGISVRSRRRGNKWVLSAKPVSRVTCHAARDQRCTIIVSMAKVIISYGKLNPESEIIISVEITEHD